MALLTDRDAIRQALDEARVVAVLGAHEEQPRPAWYVPDFLDRQHYRILPVNPHLVGKRMWGEAVVGTLAELDTPVDMVNVFRRPSALAAHLPDLLAMDPMPRTVWFQLGIRNDEVAARLVQAGMDVVQNRCTLADFRSFGLAPRVQEGSPRR